MQSVSEKLLYKRILLKLSGEALVGDGHFGIDPKVLDRLALEIGELISMGVQVAMVVGGGNIFRGHALFSAGLGRMSADHMGMLATIMNAIALRDAFERAGFSARIMSAIPMSGVVDHYDRRKAIHHLNQGRIVLFSAGTGNPLFTTDSAASLRSIEIEADILFKGTKVDGVYSADPLKVPEATLFENLSYDQALEQELQVMDLTAFAQCRDYNMKMCVFNINKPGILLKLVKGEKKGTFLSN